MFSFCLMCVKKFIFINKSQKMFQNYIFYLYFYSGMKNIFKYKLYENFYCFIFIVLLNTNYKYFYYIAIF